MMQEVEVLKTIPELVCSYFSEEQFTLSFAIFPFDSIILLRLYCYLDANTTNKKSPVI